MVYVQKPTNGAEAVSHGRCRSDNLTLSNIEGTPIMIGHLHHGMVPTIASYEFFLNVLIGSPSLQAERLGPGEFRLLNTGYGSERAKRRQAKRRRHEIKQLTFNGATERSVYAT